MMRFTLIHRRVLMCFVNPALSVCLPSFPSRGVTSVILILLICYMQYVAQWLYLFDGVYHTSCRRTVLYLPTFISLRGVSVLICVMLFLNNKYRQSNKLFLKKCQLNCLNQDTNLTNVPLKVAVGKYNSF